MTTNEKIIDILKQHPEGGEKFFNALDLMLRSDHSIGESFVDWVSHFDFYNMQAPMAYSPQKVSLHLETTDIGVILTGRFGHYIMSNYSRTIINNFKDVIIVNGGIREGQTPEIFRTSLDDCNYWILLDDSYYSGTTAISISMALKEISPSANLLQAFVVYDGSKKDEGLVKSMFRYYGEKETNRCDQ